LEAKPTPRPQAHRRRRFARSLKSWQQSAPPARPTAARRGRTVSYPTPEPLSRELRRSPRADECGQLADKRAANRYTGQCGQCGQPRPDGRFDPDRFPFGGRSQTAGTASHPRPQHQTRNRRADGYGQVCGRVNCVKRYTGQRGQVGRVSQVGLLGRARSRSPPPGARRQPVRPSSPLAPQPSPLNADGCRTVETPNATQDEQPQPPSDSDGSKEGRRPMREERDLTR